MTFSWDTPPIDAVYIWIRVEERSDPNISGKILASIGPEAYLAGNPVEFDMHDVPNGSSRYIVAEVREGTSSGLPILYYGISDSFTLSAGQHTHIEVPMNMQIPDAQAMEASVEILHSGIPVSEVNLNQIKSLTIRTRSLNARSLVVANDASFSIAVSEVSLTDQKVVSCQKEDFDGVSWDICEFVGWDLTSGLEISDQLYSVFIKFVDYYGYESTAYKTSVVLDSLGPLVLVSSLTPDVARPGSEVMLNIGFHEPLFDTEGAALHVEPALPVGVSVSGPIRIGTSNNYLWNFSLNTTEQLAESYSFAIDTIDRLGNQTEDQPLLDGDGSTLELETDSASPIVMNKESIVLPQTLFGKKDAGETITFKFNIEESNPHLLLSGDGGLCGGICPEIRLGSHTVGRVLRVETADDVVSSLLGFRYEYDVTQSDWTDFDQTVDITILWSDTAGNTLEQVVGPAIRFDFLPPGVFNCTLLPAFGNVDSIFTYSITASEKLGTVPTLKITSSTEGLFSGEPVANEGNQSFTWEQPATGIPSQQITVAAQLTDLAGNLSEVIGEPGYLCELSVSVDGEVPELTEPEVLVSPEVVNQEGKSILAVGNGDKLVVSFVVSDANGLADSYPDVRLAVPGQALPLVQSAMIQIMPGSWGYEYVLQFDAEQHQAAEGLWPIRVTLQDKNANTNVIDSLGEKLVNVDFTPPTAECSLIPSPPENGYSLGQKILLQVTPVEPLSSLQLPQLSVVYESSAVDSFFSYEEETFYRYSHVVTQDDEEGVVDVNVVLTDLVGNSTPVDQTACTDGTISGTIDGLIPSVLAIDVMIDGGNLDPTVVPLKAGRSITATVTLTNTALKPEVLLGTTSFSSTQDEALDLVEGQFTWVFSHTLEGDEGEGTKHLIITGNDAAGNTFTYEDKSAPLTLDFTSPSAKCTVFPTDAKVGDTIRLSISTNEPLADGLPVVQSSLSFLAPAPNGEATNFEFEVVVLQDMTEETSWDYTVSLADKAGNPNEDEFACSGEGIIDSKAPSVSDASISTLPLVVTSSGIELLLAGDGDKIQVSMTVIEDLGLLDGSPTIYLNVPSQPIEFTAVSVEPTPEGALVVFQELVLDADLHKDAEGSWPVKVVLQDLAGNVTMIDSLENKLVKLDFTPPEAECSLIPNSSEATPGIGGKVILQVLPLEALDKDSHPLLTVLTDPGLEEDLFEYVDGTTYLFNHIVQENSFEATFDLSVQLVDLVGNNTPEGETACSGGLLFGAMDGIRPSVESLSLLIDGGTIEPGLTPLRAGRIVESEVIVLNTAQKPEITIGFGPMESINENPEMLAENLYKWTFIRVLDGSEGEGKRFVNVSGSDAAGNLYSYIHDSKPLTLDFTGPEVICSAEPAKAKIGDSIVVHVEASEPLSGGLPVFSSPELVFESSEADAEATIFTFSHEVTEDDGALELWTYVVTATDLAGNLSTPEIACTGEGDIDAIPPQITGSMAVWPQTTDGQGIYRVGPDYSVEVTLDIDEAQGLDPEGILVELLSFQGGMPFSTQMFWGNYHATYSLKLSPVAHASAEGLCSVRVSVTDNAGNVSVLEDFGGKLINVDFTPPEALCSLKPDYSEGAAIGTPVSIQIIPLEKVVAESPILLCKIDTSFWASFFTWNYKPTGDSQVFEYYGVVEEGDGERYFELTFEGLTDVVGNSLPPGSSCCTPQGAIIGKIDGTSPTISAIEVSVDGEVVSTDLPPFGSGRNVAVTFTVTNSNLLPDVMLGTGIMNATTEQPTKTGPDDYEWVFERILDGTEGEGVQEFRFEGTDKAGNSVLPPSEPATVVLDSVKPEAVCKISPLSAAIGDTISVTVTTTEPLLTGLPILTSVLEFLPPEPDASAVSFQYLYDVSLSSPGGVFGFEVAITDQAGNLQAGDAACSGSVTIDAVPPSVQNPDLSTIPEVLDGNNGVVLRVKNDGIISTQFDIVDTDSGLKQGATDVFLVRWGTSFPFQTVTTEETQPGMFHCLAEFDMTDVGEDLAEGEWAIKVVLEDNAGNVSVIEGLGDESVIVDFTPPTALCSLSPSSGGNPYGWNKTVKLVVTPSEELQNGFKPLLNESSEPLISNGFFKSSCSWGFPTANDCFFTGIAKENAGEAAVAASIILRDITGNETPADTTACLGGTVEFDVDVIAPQVSQVALSSTGVKDPTEIPLRINETLVATFVIDEDAIGIEVLVAGQTMNMKSLKLLGNGLKEYRYEHKLVGTEGDGSKKVSIFGSDDAGNTFQYTEEDQIALFDFSPPNISCSVVPDPAIAGDTVYLTITSNELLRDMPTVIAAGLQFIPKGNFDPSSYTFQYYRPVITGQPQKTWHILNISATDLPGNHFELNQIDDHPCKVLHKLDAILPVISDVDVSNSPVLSGDSGNLMVGLDSTLEVDFKVTEAQLLSDNPTTAVYLDISGFPIPLFRDKESKNVHVYSFEFSHQFDSILLSQEGTWPIRARVTDWTGNQVVENNLGDAWVTVDFSAPVADCFINVEDAKVGTSLRLTVSLNEPVIELPSVTSELDWTYEEDLSSPNDNTPVYVFSYDVPDGIGTVNWTADIQAHDVLGNPVVQTDLCTVSGSLDGESISITDTSVEASYEVSPGVWTETGPVARSDSRLAIQFTVSELPADDTLDVQVGSEPVTDCSFNSLVCTCNFVLSGQGETGQVLPVTVELQDSAGNLTFSTVDTVLLDYEAPTNVGTAYLERCDSYARARVSQNELYVRANSEGNPYGCAYELDPLGDCGENGDSFEGHISLSAGISEPVDENLSVTVDGNAFWVDPCASSSTYIVAYYEPTGTESQGEWLPVEAELLDDAGNSATIELGQIYFDFTAPDVPETGTDGKIIYSRLPWGGTCLGETDSQARFLVRGVEGSVEHDTLVTVWAGPQANDSLPDTAAVLGTTYANSNGAFGEGISIGAEHRFELSSADQVYVYISATDQAGNVSDADGVEPSTQASLIRDVEWVATMSGKTPGSYVENPHYFETSSWFQNQVDQKDTVELGEDSGIGDMDNPDMATTSGRDLSWANKGPMENYPSQRDSYGLVNDSTRGVLVLHAGYYAGQSLSDTWEWDGITWRQISVKDPEGDGNPIGIKYHGMAYDVVRQHTVLFGGVTENGPSAQTWQYNGTSWELQSPTDPEGDGNPSARSLHSMAFDTKRGVTVLLGGYDGSNRLEDTWEWNGTSWTHIVPLDPEGDGNPAAREGGQMAFDRVRGVSVMGGGTLADYSSAQDLWEWDGSSWKQPAISDPEADGNPTLQPCMAFDTENGLTLSIRQGVVWGWDGISWEKVATYSADGVNGPQGSPFAAYFEKDELLVTLYTSHYIRPLKTWIHDGDSWQDTGPQHYASFPTPGARQYAGSAFDPGRGRMVLMGGYTGTFSEIDYASDTWEWNGHYWEEIEVTDSEGDGGPTAIYQHAMAFADHINGGEVLLFGGTTNNNFTNQSWIYDGTRWMQLNILDVVTGDGNPMARFHHNIAYDSDNHHMVLFGGREAWGSSSGLQDTWELGSYFSANEWDLMNPQDPQGDGNPAKRFAFGIAYDDALNKTVMYGGQYYMDRWSDTWEWDGASWDLVDPDDPEGDGNPGVRVNHNLVYDAYRQRTVLGFGTGDSTLWNDTWEWLGSSWRQLLLSDPEEDGNPLPRVGACMEHDTIRNNLVLIGGGSGAGSGTWIGRWGHEERPGHHAAITFWAAGNCAPPDIQELSVNYWSGGSSYVNNTPVPGAQLLVWDQGFWNIMDTNAAPAETPQLLEWSTDTSEILNRILVGDLQELHLAVTPLQYNMKYLSTISTGYLEVQVSYRLPADAESTCD